MGRLFESTQAQICESCGGSAKTENRMVSTGKRNHLSAFEPDDKSKVLTVSESHLFCLNWKGRPPPTPVAFVNQKQTRAEIPVSLLRLMKGEQERVSERREPIHHLEEFSVE
ncbi:hypothetical protein NQZ68_015632 [Dissostichus eleginoides]|nr:hypothetical protein NQZ68_015632 [Dissostichus eleginoides]